MKILLVLLLIANGILWTIPSDEVLPSSYLINDENYRCRFNSLDMYVCRSMETGSIKTKYQVNI